MLKVGLMSLLASADFNNHFMFLQSRLKRRFSCHMCEKSYTDRRHLRSHLFSSHGCGEPLKCRDCGQVFKWRVSLTTHKSHCPYSKSTAPPAPTKYSEDIVSKASSLKFTNLIPSDFQANFLSTNSEFDSNSLNKQSNDEDDQSEELKEPLICIECGEVFKRTSSLLAHKLQCSQHFTPLEGPSDKRVHVANSQPVDLSNIAAGSCL